MAQLQATVPSGVLVNLLSSIEGFAAQAKWAEQAASLLSKAPSVVLDAPADMDDAIALVQVEAALLDLGRPYVRRLTLPRRFCSTPPSQSVEAEAGVSIVAVRDDEEAAPSLPSNDGLGVVLLTPTSAEVRLGRQGSSRRGALAPAVLAAMIAEQLAPSGTRVRRVRAAALVPQWRRGALDAMYDPLYTVVRDHLAEEGSIRIENLADVAEVPEHLPEGIQHALLSRLRRSWSTMDLEARSRGMSEVVLPSLEHDALATARLEELVWHRPVVPGHGTDLIDQSIHAESSMHEQNEDQACLEMSRSMDLLLREGRLHPNA